MSIESARMNLLATIGEALQGALTTGTWRGGGFTDEIAALIDEAQADLFDAVRVLAALVYEEYPRGYPLGELACIWNPGVTEEQIEALRRVEARLAAREAV